MSLVCVGGTLLARFLLGPGLSGCYSSAGRFLTTFAPRSPITFSYYHLTLMAAKDRLSLLCFSGSHVLALLCLVNASREESGLFTNSPTSDRVSLCTTSV